MMMTICLMMLIMKAMLTKNAGKESEIIALQQVWVRGRDKDLFDHVEDANDNHDEDND